MVQAAAGGAGVMAIKPRRDDRYATEELVTHAGVRTAAAHPPAATIAAGRALFFRTLDGKRTLVLLDGRRAGPAGTRGAVGAFDLNVIPLSAIERVDILKALISYGTPGEPRPPSVAATDPVDR